MNRELTLMNANYEYRNQFIITLPHSPQGVDRQVPCFLLSRKL